MSRRSVLGISVGIAISLAVVLLLTTRSDELWPWAVDAKRHRALRERYPIENLAPRLEYENAVVGDSNTTFGAVYSTSKALSPAVSERLARSDADNSESYRAFALRELHRQQTSKFITRPGQGRRRVATPSELLEAEVPLAESLPLPQRDDESFIAIDGKTIRSKPLTEDDQHPEAAIPEQDTLLKLHDDGLGRFANSYWWGATMGMQRAAGFVSHRFMAQMPSLDSSAADLAWSITRLELVSLLKHKEPRVYVSKELPQLEKLQSVATRELDQFEEQSLAKLWHDEDIVVVEESHHIRMLGSLRAQEACLECHSVKHGQLLGAFSYELALRRKSSPQ